MASITSLGVGSGLPLQDTLDKLSNLERERLNPITNSQADNTSRKAAYISLKNSLLNYQTANTDLDNADLFATTKASSSNPDLTVSTAPGTAAGKYDIHVEQLAKAQSLATKNIPASSDKNTSGTGPLGSDAASRTLTITQKDGASIRITLSRDQTSLNGIADAINKGVQNAINNKSASADTKISHISASVINVDDQHFSLVFNASDTGLESRVTRINVDGDDALGNILNYSDTPAEGETSDHAATGMRQLVAAQNARLTVNNLAIERTSNVITNAPQGMTLTLNKANIDSTITIEKNTDDAKSAIKKWVDNYNAMLDTIGKLTRYTPVDPGAKSQSKDNGPLLGDSTVQSIKTQIRNQFSLNSGGSAFKTLAEIGITISDFTTGKLSVDESKLDNLLAQKPEAVRDLLVGDKASPGITGKIDSLINNYTASTGTFSIIEKSIDQRELDLKRRYEQISASVNDTIARYKKQFTDLDLFVKKMDGTSKYLTQQFDMLAKSTEK